MKSMPVLSVLCALLTTTPAVFAVSEMDHSSMDHSGMHHPGMDHSAMGDAYKVPQAAPAQNGMVFEASAVSSASALPTEAGNDAFGTIQEIVAILEQDPNTDWSKVNLEALRLHLADMQDMTQNIDVLFQQPIEGGMMAIVKPTSERASKALQTVFNAHPMVLKSESGWDMAVEYQDGQFAVRTTSANAAEVDKIRGLGYIGWMAMGNHHQPHHLAMARGEDPHAGHAHQH